MLFLYYLYAASLRTAPSNFASLVSDFVRAALSLRPVASLYAAGRETKTLLFGYVKIFNIIKINKSIVRSNTSKTKYARPDHRFALRVAKRAYIRKKVIKKNELSKNKIN